jgi:hypothetical protein
MTTLLENEFNMAVRVREFVAKRKAETNSLPGFNDLVISFGLGIDKVDVFATKLKTQSSGDNETARDDLIMATAETSSKAVWYASNTGNNDLLKRVKFSKKGLKRMTDLALVTASEAVYEMVNGELEEMKSYGLDSKSQEGLKAAINGFRTAKPTVKLSTTEVKQLNKGLREGIKGLYVILHKMDDAIGPFEFSNVDYFDSYHNLRKVVNTGKRSLALKIQVNNKDTGEGIEGAKVVIVPTDAKGALLKGANEGLEKKTAKKGGVNISTLSEGTYQLTVTKVGHIDAVEAIVIENEKMAKVVVGI